MGEHRALGAAGGPGRVADQRHVVGLALRDGRLEAAGFSLRGLPAHLLHALEGPDPVLLVVAHAARVVVEHQPQRGERFLQADDLVHLLLVLGHDHRDLGVVEHEG
jgi:hypothetical protein